VTLSIITINLNNAKGLLKTIKSVISQVFIDFEYIIVDGGSNDESIDIIKQHSNKIALWISEPDRGIYNAMNKGVRLSCGNMLLFLNSGDVFAGINSLNFLHQHTFSPNKILVGQSMHMISKPLIQLQGILFL